jgi:hemoglobin
MRTRFLAVGMLALSVGTLARADDKPLDRTDVDKRIVKVVYESAVLGTKIYNLGNHEGCFRLYQGALIGLQPFLDHRPKLAASVKEKLEKAKDMKAAEGAFVLRDALDEIQHEIAPGPKTEPKGDPKVEPKKTVLWERLGGEKGVKKVIDDLVAVAIEDKKVNLLRGKTLDAKEMAAFKQKLVEMISETTGGPLKYTGKDLKTAHAGMKITSDEFDALGALTVEVLKKNKVAEADIEELMKIIISTKPLIVEGKGM